MNIVLIGMRGSGKTTVGKILAKKLQKKYLETDELIVQRIGMSIPEIIANHDWEYFRDIESEIVSETAQEDNVIIATGGGVILRPKNTLALKKNGKLFWLQGNIDTLLKRIGNDQNRPLLTNTKSRKADMEETLKQRIHIYEKAANVIINTENISPKQVAQNIIKDIKEEI